MILIFYTIGIIWMLVGLTIFMVSDIRFTRSFCNMIAGKKISYVPLLLSPPVFLGLYITYRSRK